MAKKYILEPTELVFTEDHGALSANLNGTSLFGLSADDLCALIPIGATIDFNNGDRFIVFHKKITLEDSNIYYHVVGSRDGVYTEEMSEQSAFKYNYGKTNGIYFISAVTTSPGTYTVSIYTEIEDADPYPVKNFTYEHAEVAKNDIEDIIKAAYKNIGETESQAAHGHSPADRLVIVLAKMHSIDPEKALTTGNYPNQMKRIAAIFRGDFDEGNE